MNEPNSIKNMQKLTTILRESHDALVRGIRARLKEKGVEPSNLIVAEWFPDDDQFEYGIVVDASGKVFQFGYNYFNKTEDNGEFSEWHELTSKWSDIPLHESIEIALKNYEKIA